MKNDRRWDDVRVLGPYGPAGAIMPRDRELVWVNENDSLLSGLEVLCSEGFLQAPAKGGDECVGALRLSRVVRMLLEREPFKGALERLKVGDFLDLEPKYLNPKGRVDVGTDWKHDGFALVGNPSKVEGILTASDLLKALNSHVEAFVILEAIERDIRDLLDKLLPLTEYRGLVIEALAKGNPGEPKSLDGYHHFGYGHYAAIFAYEKTYKLLDRACTWERSKLIATMIAVGEIRNKVVHFRERATTEDIDTLMDVARFTRQACQRSQSANAATTPAGAD